ncbi:VC0807 family protein [Arthrobacter sp. NPDC055138]
MEKSAPDQMQPDPGTGNLAGERNSKLLRLARSALAFAAAVVVPLAVYYLLRGIGVDVYAALLVIAAVGAVPPIVALVRRRSMGRITMYFSLMSIGALLLSLLPGSEEFLLAKGAVLTAATATWFLVSLRATRPLVYVLTKPLLEGRWTWPSGWDRHWERSGRFRRMWRVATLMWAAGLYFDAVARVVMAFTLPADVVPGLATLLYVLTVVALNLVTTLYYIASGIFRPGSRLYAG